MAEVDIRDVERQALEAVAKWMPKRQRELAAKKRTLVGVIAYGPLVQHLSTEELDLIEIVEPFERATTQDVTGLLDLDPHLVGHVGLVSISWKDLQEAVRLRTPPIVSLLQSFKVLTDSGLHLRRYLSKNVSAA